MKTLISQTFILGCSLALLTTVAFAADAGTHDPAVNARQREQQRRIRQGVQSGELTKPETKSLENEQRAIRTEEKQFKADGKLTPAERQKLHTDLNAASRDIHAEKHDAEVRGTHDPVVNARQARQEGRIAEGVKSGELTGREAVRLQREERAVRVEERAFNADGKLTPAERKDLNQDLNKVSRDIYKQKHDTQVRPGTTPPTTAPSPSN